MVMFKRSEENPVLAPVDGNDWESEAVFNGCPVKDGRLIHFVYRAISSPQTVEGHKLSVSTIGYAMSADGLHFTSRYRFIKPEQEWEKYGCEDPRVTYLNKKYYIFYTALSIYPFSAEGIKIGLAITRDFGTIDAKHPVTTFNSKAMALFPGKINGKLAAVLSVNTDKPPAKIALAIFDHDEEIWSPEYWEGWYTFLDDHILPIAQSPQDQIEVGAPPLKTKYGWLLIYCHIQNYFKPPAVFGIRAVLLDLKNPRKIIAHTDNPLLIPYAPYEKYGRVPDTIFPSGAMIKGKTVYLYYGAADTNCSVATSQVDSLIETMLVPGEHAQVESLRLERFAHNPLIQPEPRHGWETKAVFNAGAIYEGGKVHLLYRAMSEDNTSVIGYASSQDGYTFERAHQPVYVPREDFEKKLVPGGNSGCEDPRLTRLDDTIYMCYCAYNGINEPRVALTSIALDDFLAQRWNWAKPVVISPPGMMDKDAAIFPRKIKGKFAILHRLGKSIWLDLRDDLNFSHGKWLRGKVMLSADKEKGKIEKIGIAAPPLETDWGWLLLYHVVAKKDTLVYELSAALLDMDDPTLVISRRKTPLLEPETPYEKTGIVNNVVFPCGAVVIGKRLLVYYGAADKVIGLATADLSEFGKDTDT